MTWNGTHLLAALVLLGTRASEDPTMKAVAIHEFGGTDKLVLESVPRPKPGAGDVLIEVKAAAVNPVDWKIRSGAFKDPRMTFPLILGLDVSGVVTECGSDVKNWKVGDEVLGMLSIARGGGYAEYVATAANGLVRKPKDLDFPHAAAVPLAALTAWQALFDQAKLARDESVLVHGGSGGVGHFAVQFAKVKGARVYATASAANQGFLKELGVDQAIDYRAQKFEDMVHDVDVVLDSIGGETLERSYGVVRKGGFIVSIVTRLDPEKLKKYGIRGASFLVTPNVDELEEITKLIGELRVKPKVGATFPLAEAAKAHEKSEAGGTPGKIVLLPR